ncbi:SDR family oxidoreductase [Catenulispora sp. NF23]|uniref:SDR family NAD(P)-dependent oxidoreductase n=1 Tax=Catenulispora pinistramenti TaxID=2705254 RepID=UPI001BA63B5C|nr:SDR family oxidoreductase [Catenulispora pinistramenti]MBS2533343.1 SDR family oxidoreductase [Catenulispora pinistramenti]
MISTTQQGRFVGKAAVVTGGSRGIGAAVARRLAAEGAAVAIGYRGNQEAADALVAELAAMGGQAIAVQADVADPGQTAALIERTVVEFGHLDVVASCAGVEHFGALETITPADFDRVFTVNTRGQLFTVQHAVPHLPAGGRIVLTSSVSASKAVFHHALYAASKAAVESMVLNLSAELGTRGIAINAIAPGGTNTDMAAENAQRYVHPDLAGTQEPARLLGTRYALRRLAEPEEVAAGYAFLASEDAAYMTGRTLRLDGGAF